jgi:hypothetical protein
MKKQLIMLFALLALTAMSVLAADVTGKWMSESTGKGGPQTYTFKSDGSSLTGTVQGGRGGPIEIQNGKVDGDNVSFDVTRQGRDGNSMTIHYSGKVEGSSMTLSFEMGGNTREVKLTKSE